MNKHVEDNRDDNAVGKEETTTIDEVQNPMETVRTASVEELIKGSQDTEIGRVVSDILRGQQAAAVYIDARSGGVFFGADAHISGDVVGREQQRTVFHDASGRQLGQSNVGIGSVVTAVLDKIATVYTKPSIFTQAATILQEKHLLILG